MKTFWEWCRRTTEGWWWAVQEDQGQPGGMDLDGAAALLHNICTSHARGAHTLCASAPTAEQTGFAARVGLMAMIIQDVFSHLFRHLPF